MEPQQILLVTQYDGTRFAGWQRQPDLRTVQGEMERALSRLAGGRHVRATAAGRTDAGVHALGQAVGVRMPTAWAADRLQRAVNSLLPADIRVSEAQHVVADFHPRFSATSRQYRYLLGTDDSAHSPFRKPWEWALGRPVDGEALKAEAQVLPGEHTFRAFAVAHTAPVNDHHRCIIQHAAWVPREGGWVFEISANRFLHHMVRFLVGTMVDVALGRRQPGTLQRLLLASANNETSPPAPPQGLFLNAVIYPELLYVREP